VHGQRIDAVFCAQQALAAVDQDAAPRCVKTGKPSARRVLFAKAY